MVTLREKQLEDEILRLNAILEGNIKESDDDKVDAVFNNIYMGERPDQRGIQVPLIMPKSPGLVVGKVYKVSREDLAYPWFKRI